MFQSRLAGECPAAGQVFVAHVGHETAFGGLVHDRRGDGRVVLHRRDAPRLRAVGDEPVGQQDHGGHMLHGQAPGLECVVETVAGRRCRHDDHGALAVAAVERLREVALLGLGRKSRRGAAALYVDHHQRQLSHHGQSQRLALERQAGARGGRHGEVAGIGGTDGRADSRDLVLGLYGLHAEVLALGQLLEDNRGRGDRVRAAEERQPGLFGCGAQSPCRGDVAADRAVGALFERCGRYGIGVCELVRIGCVVVSRLDGQLVGFGYGGVLLCEFGFDVFECVSLRPVEQVEADTQCEHVFALGHALVVEAGFPERVARHRGDAGDYYVVLVEFQLGDGVERGEARLFEVVFGDRIAVDDDRRSRFEPFAVGLERCGVHRYQHVAVVAGIQFPVAAEVNLESRYARYGTLRRADFGGVVGEGRDPVPEQRRGV